MIPMPHPIAKETGTLFINNEWHRSSIDDKIAVHNPATGETIATIDTAGPQEVEQAVIAAKTAFRSPAWKMATPAARERLLLKLADLIERDGEQLAHLETLNNGKLLFFSQALEVGGSAQWLRYMAGWATKIEGSTLDVSIPFPPGTRYNAATRRVPVGVVGAIVPWNFPLLMAIWKLAPALACGCTVVLKPAEETPLTALYLADLIREAGFPEGVVNIVTGGGDTGALLVGHPDVDKIAFTGSTEVGRLIGARCGTDLRKVSLELGGKSPVIVLDDCDPQRAIAGAAEAIFFNHGQVCTAGSRLYVSRNRYDEIAEGVATIARSIKLGPGNDPESQMGPLISRRHREKVISLIATGASDGADIIAGGKDVPGPGYFVQPTVVANSQSRNIRLQQEEVFGPVLLVTPFDDIDEAITLANNSEYGLGASVWTNDLAKANHFINEIEAGTIWINSHNMLDPNMPFGGFKASGIGREHGRSAIDNYTEIKSICIAY